MTEDQFLDRCMSLVKLLVEGMNEGPLRQLANKLGVPAADTNNLRTLKLLDLIVRMSKKATETGMDLTTSGRQIFERLVAEGVTPAQPIARLFALNDLRVLKGHRAEGSYLTKRNQALARFNIDPASTAAGFGLACDEIYYGLFEEVEEATRLVTSAV
jgi:hypothetical protein